MSHRSPVDHATPRNRALAIGVKAEHLKDDEAETLARQSPGGTYKPSTPSMGNGEPKPTAKKSFTVR